MLTNCSDSSNNKDNFSNLTISESTNNSSHKVDSSASSNATPNFAINSAFERALVADLKFDAADIDERKSCLPIYFETSSFGNVLNNLIIRKENFLVLLRNSSLNPTSF